MTFEFPDFLAEVPNPGRNIAPNVAVQRMLMRFTGDSVTTSRQKVVIGESKLQL